MPGNDLDEVRQLARDEGACEFYGAVLEELRRWGLDSDDLRDIIFLELGECHCTKSKPTEKYYPGTVSDYFSIWIEECRTKMFIKLLVVELDGGVKRLVVTSFKRDERYGG